MSGWRPALAALASRLASTLATVLASLLASLLGLALLGLSPLAQAHEAIGATAPKAYVAKLSELSRSVQSAAPANARAAAWFEIGLTLDEIRELLNQDIASHGRPQGLEAALLIEQVNALPHPLQASSRTRMYEANLAPYQQAIALDPKGTFVARARFMILKGHFYDSFTDDPLRPPGQTRAQLLAMIDLGEALLRAPGPAQDQEETRFILAMHYLQARVGGVLPAATSEARFGELLREFRLRYPTSLKLSALETLGR